MFAGRLLLIKKTALGVAAVSLGFACPSFANEPVPGEPIQWSGSAVVKSGSARPAPAREVIQFFTETNRPVEKPEEKSTLTSKLFKAYRPADSITSSDFFKQKPTLAAPIPQNPPPSSKRNDELMDRQKNWMFLSGEEKKVDATEDAFGIDEVTLESKKGVVTKFLENSALKDAAAATGKGEGDQGVNGKQEGFGLENEKPKGENESQPASSLQPVVLDKTFTGTDSERARMADLWREQYGANANRLREEKQERMKAFEGLFHSQSPATAAGGGINIDVNGPNIFGVQPLKPAEVNIGRPNPTVFPSSSDSLRTAPSPVFGATALGGTGNYNSQTFAPSTAPIMRPEPVKPIAQPAILPFPKRKF